jgi:hypothetical protein
MDRNRSSVDWQKRHKEARSPGSLGLGDFNVWAGLSRQVRFWGSSLDDAWSAEDHRDIASVQFLRQSSID